MEHVDPDGFRGNIQLQTDATIDIDCFDNLTNHPTKVNQIDSCLILAKFRVSHKIRKHIR